VTDRGWGLIELKITKTDTITLTLPGTAEHPTIEDCEDYIILRYWLPKDPYRLDGMTGRGVVGYHSSAIPVLLVPGYVRQGLDYQPLHLQLLATGE
jgi:hypothetical protein